MTPKERHFEFMKAALTGVIASDQTFPVATSLEERRALLTEFIREMADAALAEFNKRWPEEEKSGEQCFHQGGWKCTTYDEYLT